jgi:hypothetical protein
MLSGAGVGPEVACDAGVGLIVVDLDSFSQVVGAFGQQLGRAAHQRAAHQGAAARSATLAA